MIVGAPFDANEAGAAYVFRFDGISWKQEAFLKAAKPTAGDRFGCAVSVSGDVAVVGALWDDQLGWNAGATYVFERNDLGQWSQTIKLLALDGGFLEHFGSGVAIRDDRILVGARGADGVIYSTGAVYVFERSGPSTPWLQVGKLIALDGVIDANLGAALSFDGLTLFVGAPGDWSPAPATGAVYVFVVNAAGEWSQVGKVFPANVQAQSELGTAVASAGSLAVLGNRLDDEKGWDAGAAWVYAVGPDANSNGLMDPCECPGDLNKGWIVDQADLGLLLANWGCTGGLGYEPSQKPCPGALTACCGGLDAGGRPRPSCRQAWESAREVLAPLGLG